MNENLNVGGGPPDEPSPIKRNALTKEEHHVILEKGTESPFSGKYWNHFAEGWYACKYCDALLYRSQDKFRSDCGWPSFDDAIPGAVKRHPDPDGIRTEITCARCEGHLGHLFHGEWLTTKNVRHCANSLSLRFIPEDLLDRAVFAGGCFWGVEYHFENMPGVLATTVGYTGGEVEHPTYAQVSTGRTGHVEAVEVVYDPKVTTFEVLARHFFQIHDPTQVDRQGPDVGQQYQSALFYTDAEQHQTAEKLIHDLRGRGFQVFTRLEPVKRFYQADPKHQKYYSSKGKKPSCHFWTSRFDEPSD